VFGTGGSRRAGEQAAAKLALEAVQATLVKTPSAARKPRPRTAQLKLAGIATIQSDPAAEGTPPVPVKAAPKPHGKSEPKSEPRLDHKPETGPDAAPAAAQINTSTNASKSKSA
jgi:ribonuclease-3